MAAEARGKAVSLFSLPLQHRRRKAAVFGRMTADSRGTAVSLSVERDLLMGLGLLQQLRAEEVVNEVLDERW